MVRTVIGPGLLGLPAWFLMPGLWTVTSNQAIVNAQLITLTSPIEGVVTFPPPPLGQHVSEGSVLLRIEAPRVDRKHLDELRTEVATLTERAAALKEQLKRTLALKTELRASFENYKDSMVRRLSHELVETRSEAAAAVATHRQRESEASEEEALMQRGFSSQRELRESRFMAEIAGRNAERANAALARVNDQLIAMRNGVFTGPGDSRNDVPYSQQRLHEITLQEQIDEGRLRESQARLTRLQTEITHEAERVTQRTSFQAKAPLNGIIWRHFVASGSSVAPQTELLQIADTSTAFVDASFNEKFGDELKPGDRVTIHLPGSDIEVPGKIRYLVGGGVPREDRTLAAELPKTGEKEVHGIIDFDRVSSRAEDVRQFLVGRRAEVRFPELAKSVLRLR
jgi:multidrug resistance efflux pump